MVIKSNIKSKRLIFIFVIIAIGLVTLIATKAATPTTSLQPEGGTRSANVSIATDPNASGSAIKFGTTAVSCGKQVQNYTYQVPFGNAVWNQPVCNLPHHPLSADYANRFYKWANLNDGSTAGQQYWGGLGTGFGIEDLRTNFSRNVYYASDANTTIQIQASVYDSNLDGNVPYGDYRLHLPDTRIPWNGDWNTGQGGDNEIVILDKTSGKIYELFGVMKDLDALRQCGPFFTDRLCTYTAVIGRDSTGQVFDYRTFDGDFPMRGVGISSYATLTTPEEVAAGEIRHALGVAIPNTAIGPICTKEQLGTSAEGYSCGTAVAPAAKFEWAGITTRQLQDPVLNALYTQDKLIPEGMRFAINITDAQIDAWINSRTELKSNARKAETARIFARAIRDYGFIIADTSGAGAGIQMAGAVNPIAKQQWANLGMDSLQDYSLLNGLITSTNLYVIDSPTNNCSDGTQSKYYCYWTSARYGN